MKKILLSLLSVLMLFMLVGCGGDTNVDTNEDTNNNTEVDNNTNNSSNINENEIKLYSDSTKMVFKSGNSQLVYYYSGEKITGYVAYIDYETTAMANYALSILNLEDDATIKKAYTNGRYLVVEYAESEYEDTTASEIRALYSYLEAAQNK